MSCPNCVCAECFASRIADAARAREAPALAAPRDHVCSLDFGGGCFKCRKHLWYRCPDPGCHKGQARVGDEGPWVTCLRCKGDHCRDPRPDGGNPFHDPNEPVLVGERIDAEAMR